MKNMSIRKKLIMGFSLPIILTIINIVVSIVSGWGVTSAENIERYMRNASFFMIALGVVSIVLTVMVEVSLVRQIRLSIEHLSDVTKQIAMGRVDIDMHKNSNDEFGQLVDEYAKVVDNIKYQAHVAEEVANGNLTLSVNSRSNMPEFWFSGYVVSRKVTFVKLIVVRRGYRNRNNRKYFSCDKA